MSLLSDRVKTLSKPNEESGLDLSDLFRLQTAVAAAASLEPTIILLQQKLEEIENSLAVIEDIVEKKKELGEAKKHISRLLSKLTPEVHEVEEKVTPKGLRKSSLAAESGKENRVGNLSELKNV